MEHLSSMLGFSTTALDDVSKNSNEYYRTFSIPKPNGTYRTIYDPQKTLKKIQDKIKQKLLMPINLSDMFQGGRKKGSTQKNAQMHAGQACVLNLDIKDFFPSIRTNRVMNIFKEMGCVDEVAAILSKLTTYRGSLPQGASTSSMIANLSVLSLGERLSTLCEKHKFKLSFYVDDITISGDEKLSRFKSVIQKIIQQEGFKLNKNKVALQRSSGSQKVTGLTINSGMPNIPKKYLRTLRATIHNCIVKGPETQTDSSLDDFKAKLAGQIAYVNSINQVHGKKLKAMFSKINWDKTNLR